MGEGRKRVRGRPEQWDQAKRKQQVEKEVLELDEEALLNCSFGSTPPLLKFPPVLLLEVTG
jgi:hypothetical protein